MTSIIDFILHIDHHLVQLAADYGLYIYLILFIIVFVETGFVVTPFLPGDSLLFASGGIAAIGKMNPFILFFTLCTAAILGNFTNYFIGYKFGNQVVDRGWVRKSYMDKTIEYFVKYGKSTIIISRFVPIVRTITPFVAGIGKMDFKTFGFNNVLGAVVWVGLFLTLGYFVGNLDFVKRNFSVITLCIIGVSMIPLLITIIKGYFGRNKQPQVNADK